MNVQCTLIHVYTVHVYTLVAYLYMYIISYNIKYKI